MQQSKTRILAYKKKSLGQDQNNIDEEIKCQMPDNNSTSIGKNEIKNKLQMKELYRKLETLEFEYNINKEQLENLKASNFLHIPNSDSNSMTSILIISLLILLLFLAI